MRSPAIKFADKILLANAVVVKTHSQRILLKIRVCKFYIANSSKSANIYVIITMKNFPCALFPFRKHGERAAVYIFFRG